jgi:murein DD-endopeptidase MepM/ murein hydrolase activator NlpD
VNQTHDTDQAATVDDAATAEGARRAWLAAAACGVIMVAVAGFGLANRPRLAPSEDAATNSQAAESLAAADETAEIEAAVPVQLIRALVVNPGETLVELLIKAEVAAGEARAAVAALAGRLDPRRIKSGQIIRLTLDESETGAYRLAALNLALGADREITVTRQSTGFSAREWIQPLTRRFTRAKGVIRDSLYAAGRDAGIPRSVLAELIRMYSYDVDFQRDVQPGDAFEVFFEQFVDDSGRGVKDGEIYAAVMTLRNAELRYYRYSPPGKNDVEYFDARGQSARKALLRTPVDGARLSSRFGRRDHPILGYTRMHQGVDFAAPHGTPVQAAGDGVVEVAGAKDDFGKYIRLRHNSSLSTAYGHLSRIGVHIGQRVRQGQIIGNVGATGMSTGPHLHYELLVDRRPVNPMSLRQPTGRKLAGKEFEDFRQTVLKLDEQIAAVPARQHLARD